MNQTPASKKFLQPSSSSRLQNTSSSTRRTPFVRPSQSSSSPYSRAPFSTRVHDQDDIETSFDEEKGSPLADAARLNISNAQVDSIDGDDGVSVEQRAATPSSPYSHAADHNEGAISLSAREYVVDVLRADFSSPLPKRQKLSYEKHSQRDRIQISSSPDSRIGNVMDGDHNDSDNEPLDHEIYENHGGGSSEVEDSHLPRSRFRIHTATDVENKAGSERPNPRVVFKGMSTGGPSWSEAPLPVIFSPSKRKGKYEYVYNGAAETARGWILDIANQQSKANEAKIEKLHITHVMEDISGRFHIVEDEKGQIWMLVNQDEQRGMLQTGDGKVKPARQSVALKGSGTTWALETCSRIDQVLSSQLKVAVLWEPALGESD